METKAQEEGVLTGFGPRWVWQAAGLALVGAVLIRCSNGTEYVLEGAEGELASPPLGTAGFHLDVGNGLVFNQLTSTLTLPDNTFQTQTTDLSPDDSSITIYLGELPVGSGYQIALSATSTTGFFPSMVTPTRVSATRGAHS